MSLRALIVDDEILARKALSRLLKSEPGVSVIGQCGDGESAVDAIRRAQPDLVFLDVQMPEMDGFRVVEAMSVLRSMLSLPRPLSICFRPLPPPASPVRSRARVSAALAARIKKPHSASSLCSTARAPSPITRSALPSPRAAVSFSSPSPILTGLKPKTTTPGSTSRAASTTSEKPCRH
jgi:response regulator RpfG family c-di-GMP phosphodiesterase